MRVKPRYSEDVFAVRINHDLLAEAGSYLVVGDDDVEVMSETDFERLFVITNGERKPHTTRKMPPPPRTRYRLSADQNILLAFGPAADGTYLKDLTISGLSRILPRVPVQRLLERCGKLLREKKLETKMERDQLVYNITEDGKGDNRAARERR
jgi:hypothetical protein